jgi:D-alanyl-D-alanine carboxypeptidase/poly-gamma-glutamate capsule biosynthesis protein CapA/YwtB (metallophosphatase superfamily)
MSSKLKFALAIIIGSALGASLFYGALGKGMSFFKKTGAPPSKEKVEQTLVAQAADEGFYYKPLLDPSNEIPKEGKAVYADLNEMTLTLYENGVATTSFSIVSKGRPGSFWETPTGEYRVLTKEEKHFSSIGQVWMPYSMGFFGNFFIHGWPTYPSGASVPQGFSGGCIRLKTEDSKKVYGFVETGTPIIVTEEKTPLIGEHGYMPLRHTNPPALSAKAFLVGDLDNNYVFLEKNRSEARPIASITKLMSAIISLEAINQDNEVEISKSDLDIHGDSGNLVMGEHFTAKNLLLPLLLSSSNDAAYALARMIGVTHFVNLMNAKAAALKLSNTHFSDPSGLEMKNVSTAEELLYLLKYTRDVHAPLLEISRTSQMRLTTDKASHVWFNFNWKSHDDMFQGGKIGYIDAAGQTMVALFRVPMSEFTTRDIGVVVLGSTDHENDVKKLMSWVRANFIYGSSVEHGNPPKSPFTIKEGESSDENFSMLFVGDIMMDRGIRKTVETVGKGNYSYPFDKIRDFITGADLAFANLEGPISDQGENHGSIYSFRMDPASTKAIYDAGFDILSLANNHMGDYGRQAMEDTMRRLRRAGVAYTGAGWNSTEARQPTIIERAGERVGFLGFSDVGPAWMEAGDALSGILLADPAQVTDAVRQARGKVDILVVSFHFGEEYHTVSSARQKELARAAIDAGANIVIGHHPHVAEEVEEYHGGVIAYSLGNFVFDQAFSPDTKEALMVELDMKAKKVEVIKKIPIEFTENFQPEIKKAP